MAGLLAAPLARFPGQARAEAWPVRPVRCMVPYPPGGPTDILGRVIAQRLSQEQGQPMVVENRAAAYPDLPTVAEAGVPGFDVSTWYGIWAPPRTPAPIVARLQQAVAAVVKVPEVRERLAVLGADPVADTPEEFAAFCASEHARWGKLVQDAGLRLD